MHPYHMNLLKAYEGQSLDELYDERYLESKKAERAIGEFRTTGLSKYKESKEQALRSVECLDFVIGEREKIGDPEAKLRLIDASLDRVEKQLDEVKTMLKQMRQTLNEVRAKQ